MGPSTKTRVYESSIGGGKLTPKSGASLIFATVTVGLIDGLFPPPKLKPISNLKTSPMSGRLILWCYKMLLAWNNPQPTISGGPLKWICWSGSDKNLIVISTEICFSITATDRYFLICGTFRPRIGRVKTHRTSCKHQLKKSSNVLTICSAPTVWSDLPRCSPQIPHYFCAATLRSITGS